MQAQELAEAIMQRVAAAPPPIPAPAPDVEEPAVSLDGRVPPPLTPGDRSEAVGALQTLLVDRWKLTPGTFTPDVYDRATERGVQALQRSLRERDYTGPIHGRFDADTRETTVEWDLLAEQVSA